MQTDEQAIRALIADWQTASAEGNGERLGQMMADDVVFLVPGQPPIRGKQAFLAAFEEGSKHFTIESQGEIRELYIDGGLAYCWTNLTVTATPHQDGLPMQRSGNVLSVLRKLPDGRWVIVRDANMLTPKPVAVPA